ncbi:aromatic ring-hydroxylating dioxygenase subunit alpha [Mycolicibacterium sphagni]|uniref:aromatic ring-hydroxylating dioxygenase subunit alpha n=1 Tax=Mycolicibacterium sphagni TaxID=1786 RepID=UPI0021F356F9|nr:aromatic ring-hydroxylating dioxygenase subunit alpha [Mycolicibacterium sphagni]MCV7177822.1 aromatic ring-hydroxylating dioxygenase subunit alpha [Mycolicibacterium sphagni]
MVTDANAFSDDVRQIDGGTNPTRFARGWHCLGLAKTFHDGRPHQIDAFGTSLVVFESADGTLNTLDAYCRHMGGNLAQGTIKGDGIACPFHDWRWGGDGKCLNIPYSRRVPRTARTQAWPTLERNGLVFIWNDPRRRPPPESVDIPVLDAYGSSEWTDWSWNSLLVEGTNCRELIDNVVDMAHFFYVHLVKPTFFKNVFEKHVASQFMSATGRPDIELDSNYGQEGLLMESSATYYGPAYMVNGQTLASGGAASEGLLINCHYPVTPNSFVLQWGAIAKKNEGMSDDEASAMATQFADSLGDAFMQDVEIWRNKTRVDNPLLCEEDGPVYQLRRWYEQFYVDEDDIVPEMVNRFEFEVDLHTAQSKWDVEMTANMAAAKQAPAGV